MRLNAVVGRMKGLFTRFYHYDFKSYFSKKKTCQKCNLKSIRILLAKQAYNKNITQSRKENIHGVYKGSILMMLQVTRK